MFSLCHTKSNTSDVIFKEHLFQSHYFNVQGPFTLKPRTKNVIKLYVVRLFGLCCVLEVLCNSHTVHKSQALSSSRLRSACRIKSTRCDILHRWDSHYDKKLTLLLFWTVVIVISKLYRKLT